MSSTHTSDLSTTPTTSTNSLSSTSPTDSSTPTGDQSAAVHINNLYILTFVALVLVFVVTCCTVLMRRRDRRRLFTEAMTDGLMRAPRLPGPIPQLHDLQVVWGGPGWKDIMPVTADAIEASIITGPTRPHTNTNTSSATTPTNENYNYNLNTDGGSVSADTKSAAASTVISATGTNQVRIDVLQVAVLIAMPDPASTQSSRRNRGRLKRAPEGGVAEKRSTEVEAGDVHEHEDDSYYDHDELPILMIGVTRVSPGDYSVDSEVE